MIYTIFQHKYITAYLLYGSYNTNASSSLRVKEGDGVAGHDVNKIVYTIFFDISKFTYAYRCQRFSCLNDRLNISARNMLCMWLQEHWKEWVLQRTLIWTSFWISIWKSMRMRKPKWRWHWPQNDDNLSSCTLYGWPYPEIISIHVICFSQTWPKWSCTPQFLIIDTYFQ